MTRNQWIKRPGGTLARQRPDRVALFLAERAPLVRQERPPVPPLDSGPRHSGQSPTYRTKAFDMGALHGVQIVHIGAGSLGSHIAYRYGPAGVRANLIDPGTVEPKHVRHARTIYDATQIGQKKVLAAKQKIEREFPGTKVNAYPYNTDEVPDSEFKSMFASSYVVILAFDDPSEILRLAALAYPITELIQPAMHKNGDSGHVVVTVPFVTPCLQCTLGINQATDIHRLDSEPANSMDIINVAEYTARLTLDIVHSKVTGNRISRWDTAKNLIYIANTREELSPDGPGVHYETSQRRPGCVVCNHRTPS